MSWYYETWDEPVKGGPCVRCTTSRQKPFFHNATFKEESTTCIPYQKPKCKYQATRLTPQNKIPKSVTIMRKSQVTKYNPLATVDIL